MANTTQQSQSNSALRREVATARAQLTAANNCIMRATNALEVLDSAMETTTRKPRGRGKPAATKQPQSIAGKKKQPHKVEPKAA